MTELLKDDAVAALRRLCRYAASQSIAGDADRDAVIGRALADALEQGRTNTVMATIKGDTGSLVSGWWIPAPRLP